mmetsp:Transcript_5093/g.6366  ORF Transcript_5093/g.6366 Transcript_5093/m.6366 type:complete len:268 (+) Transcript_5093:444-1247(+)
MNPELLPPHIQNPHVFPRALPGDQTRRDATTRLTNPKSTHEGFRGSDKTLVLVSPDDEVHPFRYHTLMNAVFAPASQIAILMQGKQIEKSRGGRFVRRRTEEPHFLPLPHAIQTLIPHTPQPIKRHRRTPLPNNHRPNLNLIHLTLPPEIIHQIRHTQQIQRRQRPVPLTSRAGPAVTRRIVVIPVYRKHGQVHGVVIVFVIRARKRGGGEVLGLVGEDFEGDGVRAEAVAAEDFHCAVEGLTGGFVVVEEISGEEDHVALVTTGER